MYEMNHLAAKISAASDGRHDWLRHSTCDVQTPQAGNRRRRIAAQHDGQGAENLLLNEYAELLC